MLKTNLCFNWALVIHSKWIILKEYKNIEKKNILKEISYKIYDTGVVILSHFKYNYLLLSFYNLQNLVLVGDVFPFCWLKTSVKKNLSDSQ